MPKFLKWSGYFLIAAIVVVGGLLIFQKSVTNPEPQNLMVGGDRDAHGCIGSAGYSWCEIKSKCLRIWEEACSENLKEQVQYLLAKKYGKALADVTITITKQTDTHASGSVSFSKGVGAGGVFLVTKINNVWSVVFDGNGSIDCKTMRQTYGFGDDILKPNFCD